MTAGRFPVTSGSLGGRIPNAMTVDVEDYFHASALARDPEGWDGLESRVVGNTRRLLALFERFGMHATFFVLGWVAERHPGLVREIAASGHEIACHGFSHRLVYEQSPEEFRRETSQAKRLLEDILGAPVLGYRAASYSIVRRSMWALDVLLDLGFAYDSSIFPVYHDRYGVPDAQRLPYRVVTPAGRAMVEWPLSTVQLFGYKLPVAGGGYFRLLPYWLIRRALSTINDREHQPFIFYLHPWEIDPGQPRFPVGRLSQFRHYTNLDKCEERLTQLLHEFKFGRASDALELLGLLPGSSSHAAAGG